MKKYLRHYSWVLSLFGLWYATACDTKLDDEFPTDIETLTITQYLEQDGEHSFELFLKMLDRSKIGSVVGAYGSFTCFAPDDDAVNEYLKTRDYSTVDDIPEDLLRLLVEGHITNTEHLAQTLSQGAMADTTLAGKFITVAFGEGGLENITLSGTAKIVKRDVKCSNGLVHVVDGVIRPISDEADGVLERRGDFGIFVKALRETKVLEHLAEAKLKYSLFAEPDAVFAEAGIADYEALKAKYSAGGDVSDPANGLYKFVAYHFLKNDWFTSDLTTYQENAYQTFNGEMLRIDRGSRLLLNPKYDERGRITENIFIDEVNIDLQSANGVIFELDNVMEEQTPEPFVFYSDFFRVPEFRHTFRTGAVYTVDEVERWSALGLTDIYVSGGGSLGSQVIFQTYGGWFEFVTHVVPKGKHKVAIKFRAVNEDNVGSFYVGIDGQRSSRIIDGRTDSGYLEFGTYTFEENSTHVFRIESVRPGRAFIDDIRFTPVTE
ncbi:hypothetical protein FUAX_48220 (plasmid) [Fulvitalea axinellae]|uniref:FAS1 domain-containing protein n=1 Tax=Fulvitalea axinellae TaxID=1182444 RepID=A0AAU9DIJ7_9BACT|nr:hypothetical protein FUAX_48220 [Fulvitalea axinellae]